VARLLPLLALAVVLLAGPGAPAARAGDEAPAAGGAADALARLTAEEQAFLAQRIPRWAELPEAKRQHIARNVIRLRELSPEARARFRERLRAVTDRRAPDDATPLERLQRHGTRMLAARGVGSLARAELGLDAEAGLAAQGVSPATFDLVFSRLFWERALQRELRDGAPPAPEAVAERLSGEARERYAEAFARWRDVPEGAARQQLARQLALRLALHRADALRHALAPADRATGDTLALALGRRLRDAWPEAFAETLALVRDEPARFAETASRDESRRAVESLARGRGRLARDDLRLLVWLADRFASHHLAERPEARARVDALVTDALVEALEVPREAVARLPGREDPEAREAALARVLRLPPPRRAGAPGRGFPRRPGK
jgi:hypothetical protein